jgi:hypothetical protein
LTVREVTAVLETLPQEPSTQDWARVADALVCAAQARLEQFRGDLDDLQTITTVCMSSSGSLATGNACR